MAEHSALSELRDKLSQAADLVSVGSRYVHYKGSAYLVVGLAIVEATEQVAVMYRAETDPDITFVRPLFEWIEKVTVSGKITGRFTLVN